MSAATRRCFLRLLPALGVSLASLGIGMRSMRAATAADTVLSPAQIDALAIMARAILPHDAAPADLYRRVAESVAQRLGDAEQFRLAITTLERLNALTQPAGWSRATTDARRAALTQLQNNEFFALVRNVTVEVLYRDPEVWRLVGYGGNSMAHGGYLTRGFDRVDWLDD